MSRPCWRKKKLLNVNVTVIPIVIGARGKISKGRIKGLLRNHRKSRKHPDYSITKIGQNPEKSPGNLRRLVVTQTPVQNHQLTLV